DCCGKEYEMIGVTETGRSDNDFFFQAEDGIRDGHVTGVQTCALPISRLLSSSEPRPRCISGCCLPPTSGRAGAGRVFRSRTRLRSEERRVGKECRSRWGADHDNEINRHAKRMEEALQAYERRSVEDTV